VLPKQHGHRSDCLSQFEIPGLIGGIHAVSPEQNRRIGET
jgi:hypothetical protein